VLDAAVATVKFVIRIFYGLIAQIIATIELGMRRWKIKALVADQTNANRSVLQERGEIAICVFADERFDVAVKFAHVFIS
jgi:hypothetical protein